MWRGIVRDAFSFPAALFRQTSRLVRQNIWEIRQVMRNDAEHCGMLKVSQFTDKMKVLCYPASHKKSEPHNKHQG